jgi:hypothetical protein
VADDDPMEFRGTAIGVVLAARGWSGARATAIPVSPDEAAMFMLTPSRSLGNQAVGQPGGMTEANPRCAIWPAMVPAVAIAPLPQLQ